MSVRRVEQGAPPSPLTEASLAEAAGVLARSDGYLAGMVERHGPPPLWGRPPGFATLVHIILEQQVSLASAAALHRRLGREIGGGLAPEAVALCGPDGLRRLGVTRQKAHYVSGLAARIVGGDLRLNDLGSMSDGEAAEELMRVPGIGPWTASIYLLMALLRPDVWPSGDLALNRMLALRQPGADRVSPEVAERLSRRWSPWRSVAARILWHAYLSGSAATPRVGSTRG